MYVYYHMGKPENDQIMAGVAYSESLISNYLPEYLIY